MNELSAISKALSDAISEAQSRILAGDRGPDFLDLIRHMRELLELFTEGLEQLGEDPRVEGGREMAAKFQARLGAIQRDVAGTPLH